MRRLGVGALVAGALLGAAPAQGATLQGTAPGGFVYAAGPGERNDVTLEVKHRATLLLDWPLAGFCLSPYCEHHYGVRVRDTGASIVNASADCQPLAVNEVYCVSHTRRPPAASAYLSDGDDRLTSVDLEVESIFCGDGRDFVITDLADRRAASCELHLP